MLLLRSIILYYVFIRNSRATLGDTFVHIEHFLHGGWGGGGLTGHRENVERERPELGSEVQIVHTAVVLKPMPPHTSVVSKQNVYRLVVP